MLIVGTGGHALDLLDVVVRLNLADNLCFFNNVDPAFEFEIPFLKNRPVIRKNDDLADYFSKQPHYVLATGNPKSRKALNELMLSYGGKPVSLVSPLASIGHINNHLGEGLNIMNHVVITSNVSIGKGSLINTGSIITHDCRIGEYVEISPGVNIAGACHIMDHVFIGTGACILPKITIGKNSVVAAGAVVIKDVPDHVMVAGNPAVVKKKI